MMLAAAKTQNIPGCTRSGGAWPSRKVLILMITFSPMSMRPSMVAEPMCGRATTRSDAKRFGATCDGLPDSAHSDDAEALAPDAVAEHPRGRPALPVLGLVLEKKGAFRQSARHGKDQRHCHVGRVFSEHTGRVGDNDAAVAGRVQVDVVDPRAKIRDQLELRTSLRQ